jgi:predicted DNA-binding protein (MmcQ/YjbR family)
VANNKVFAWMVEDEAGVRLTVKLTKEEREIAFLLPFVSVAKYVGRYGWITASVTDDESLDAALEWLRESYWLKAPARLRGAVEGS